jgi:hypothetical protein
MQLNPVFYKTRTIPAPPIKERPSLLAKSHILYLFQCRGSATYVGLTERQLKFRISEHILAWVKNQAAQHNGLSNEYVRKLVFGNGDYRLLAALLKQQRFRWLGHVLHMPPTRLPHQMLLALLKRECRKKSGGQAMIWELEMKTAARDLVRVGACRLPGWDPRDPPLLWLHTLE